MVKQWYDDTVGNSELLPHKILHLHEGQSDRQFEIKFRNTFEILFIFRLGLFTLYEYLYCMKIVMVPCHV